MALLAHNGTVATDRGPMDVFGCEMTHPPLTVGEVLDLGVLTIVSELTLPFEPEDRVGDRDV